MKVCQYCTATAQTEHDLQNHHADAHPIMSGVRRSDNQEVKELAETNILEIEYIGLGEPTHSSPRVAVRRKSSRSTSKTYKQKMLDEERIE